MNFPTAPTSCPHQPPCAACPRFGEPGIDPQTRRVINELVRVHGLPEVSVISGHMTGFRHRARLAIRGRLGSPKLGLFEAGTHRVVHIPNCSVQHSLINRVATVVRRALVDTRVTSYSDAAHAGLARYLQVVVERGSQTAQVVIAANSATVDPLAASLELIRERLGNNLHSLWFNSNCARGNAIFGSHFQNWCGPASVVERFGGEAVHYPPGAFGQNNLDIAQRIIEHVRAEIPKDARVAEFYAGVGAIGLSVLTRVGEIRMNEVSPHSLHGLDLGLAQLDCANRAKISVIAGSAGAAHAAAAGAQVVLANPPRKGLDPELSGYLSEHPPERFVYVSCALKSFRDDLSVLTARGKLRLGALTVFNLLPFTAHVEILGRFERV